MGVCDLKWQIRSEIAWQTKSNVLTIAQTPSLAAAAAKADAGELLTTVETVQFRNQQVAMHRSWENVHYQYRNGLYDEAEFASHKKVWAVIMNGKPARLSFWCERRQTYSPEYRAELEGMLEDLDCNE